MFFWESGYVGIWASGHLGIWVSWRLGIWASGHLDIWFSGHLGVWASEILGILLSGHFVSGHLGIWASGHLGLLKSGNLGVWWKSRNLLNFPFVVAGKNWLGLHCLEDCVFWVFGYQLQIYLPVFVTFGNSGLDFSIKNWVLIFL